MNTTPSLLELEKITLSYLSSDKAAKPVLQDLCLCLNPGELACLLGVSGSGKSSLLRAIAGFEPLRKGRIVLGGHVLNQGKKIVAAHRRQVGLMFQEYALFSHLNVAANIGFGLADWPSQQRTARIQALLDLIGLRAHAHMMPEQLSGGQQQRVALARALAPKPKLLLLDEPFSNLDAGMREPLALHVREILKNENISALLVTHDQLESFALADRIGVLHNGKIVQWDTPQNLYQKPQTRFVADFVGLSNFLPATVAGDQAKPLLHTELGVFPGLIMPAPKAPTIQIPCSTHCNALGTTNIQVLLRPQHLILDPSSPYQAQLMARTFRGADSHYRLRLPSGRELLAAVPEQQTACAQHTSVGSVLGVRISASMLTAFTE